ncbi:MAG: hypothetical protein HRU32_07815, partial [Rhodobacteraceae bacterium]|nr:hypothetical protein [Paracoccaceae bacterium]
MAEAEENPPEPSKPASWRGRLSIWTVLLALVVYFAFFLGALAVTGRAVVLPDRLTFEIQNRLDEALGSDRRVALGQARLIVGRDGVPRLVLRDVGLQDNNAGQIANLNEVALRFSPLALASGQIRLVSGEISGAQMTLRRDVEGALTLTRPAGGEVTTISSVGEFNTAFEALFALPILSELSALRLSELTLAIEDARSGRLWQATNASADILRTEAGLEAALRTDIFNGTDALAWLEVTLDTGPEASFGAIIRDFPAQDIALQAPSLSFLDLVDAPVSGSFRALVSDQGEIDQVAAVLTIAAGEFRPRAEVDPLPFDDAELYLRYVPQSDLLTIDQIAVQTPEFKLVGTGSTFISGYAAGWPVEWVGQLQLIEGELGDTGVLANPVSIDDARADVRLRLDPFSLDIGQLTATLEETSVAVTGQVSAGNDGWSIDLDAQVPKTSPTDVLAFWPVDQVRGLRTWLEANVLEGELTNGQAAVRYSTLGSPEFGFSFDFDEASV